MTTGGDVIVMICALGVVSLTVTVVGDLRGWSLRKGALVTGAAALAVGVIITQTIWMRGG